MKVFVVVITHEHGANVTVHATAALASAAVRSYVDDNWDVECGDFDKPEDPEEAARFYFDDETSWASGTETCHIEECEVEGGAN